MRSIQTMFAAVLVLAACGGEDAAPLEILESGAIEEGDPTDPNHAGLAYDSYDFQVAPLDTVTVGVDADGFDPLLKLVEVSTGAVLAEWDSQYPIGDCLTYVIAGGGTCQARVYALEHGSGEYEITIAVRGR